MKKLLLLLPVSILLSACNIPSPDMNHTIWYDYPAEYWNSQSLHLGNAFIGASFFGGVETEKFALTEGSMWRGGPFRGDWEEFGVNPKANASIDKIRQAVIDGNIHLADSLSNSDYLGDMTRFGNFTFIGDLLIEMDHAGSLSKYRRSLDMQHSLGSVSYTLGETSYRREYFCSYPDRILAMKFSSDKPGAVGFDILMDIIQQEYDFQVENGKLLLTGYIDNTDQRKFTVQIEIIPFGGSLIHGEHSIGIADADSAVVLLAAGTDYKQEYPEYRGPDPEITCNDFVTKAKSKGYEQLRQTHIDDYTALYSRVALDLNSNPILDQLPTNVRWDRFRARYPEEERIGLPDQEARLEKYPLLKTVPPDLEDTGLKELVFNLGKYLIISSSRPGSLPANLQGKWNTFYVPPWTGNYQANINIQEIYWPCGPMDLLECQEPYVDWTVNLAESGRRMAKQVYGTSGWISHTIGNIYGHTAPVGGIPWGVYPLAPVWHCQHLWEQFRFSQDTTYLSNVAYPVIKEAARFWLENLFEYDGYLVVAPTISAEHGTQLRKEGMKQTYSEDSYGREIYTLPSAQDAQMVEDLFGMCLEAAGVLQADNSFIDSVKSYRERLLPHQIGRYGQLQEWYEDLDSPEDQHRHISHMYAVCPGNDIHPITTPELAEAAKKSLELRGDGRHMDFEIAAGGNWSRAWRFWCWARLMEGDNAHLSYEKMLAGQGFENLTTHQHAEYDMGRPDLFHEPGPMYLHYQLDATASTPGFMAEMLLQSHLGELILLPALPSSWKEGEITGVKARGNYTLDIAWKNGELKKAVIHTRGKELPPVRIGEELIDPYKDKRIEVF